MREAAAASPEAMVHLEEKTQIQHNIFSFFNSFISGQLNLEGLHHTVFIFHAGS